MEKTEPIFSIILPTYNRAKLLTRSIDSVLRQTFTNWELIVIDDGSTDNTKSIVRKIYDKRIKYFYQENQERSVARNNGIAKAKGLYICFLDSDDFYLPNHLSLFHQALENKGWPYDEVFVSGMKGKTEKGLMEFPLYRYELGSPVNFFWKNGPSVNIFCIPRKILMHIKFPEQFHLAEDLHFVTRLLLSCPVNPIGEHTFVAVEHSERSSNQRFRENIKYSLKSNISAIDDVLALENEKLKAHLKRKDINDLKYQLFYMYANGAIKRGLPNLGFQLSLKMLELRQHPSVFIDLLKLLAWQAIFGFRRILRFVS